jgi:hypothetical protein
VKAKRLRSGGTEGVAGATEVLPLNSTPATLDGLSPVEPASLTDILASLRALPQILTRLTAALDRQALAELVEPLLDRSDLATVLRCSLVTLDRLKAAGRLPKPDVMLSRSPRWRVQTFRSWLEKGGRP